MRGRRAFEPPSRPLPGGNIWASGSTTSQSPPEQGMMKAVLWIVLIIFVVGLLVVFGVLDLIF
jgi:hypothetical protein